MNTQDVVALSVTTAGTNTIATGTVVFEGSEAYLDDANSEKLLNAVNQVYRTGESVKALDWTFNRRDGSERFAESSITLISDSKGQPVGFGGFLAVATLLLA